MTNAFAASRRDRALLVGLELIPLVGPAAFCLIFLAAYVLTPSWMPSFVTGAIADVLLVLAVTPLLAGAGWLVSGYRYIGGLVLLLRGVTCLAAALVLVAETSIWVAGVVIVVLVAEPLVSAVALSTAVARRSAASAG